MSKKKTLGENLVQGMREVVAFERGEAWAMEAVYNTLNLHGERRTLNHARGEIERLQNAPTTDHAVRITELESLLAEQDAQISQMRAIEKRMRESVEREANLVHDLTLDEEGGDVDCVAILKWAGSALPTQPHLADMAASLASFICVARAKNALLDAPASDGERTPP